jgi:hypothetical protein
VTLGVTIDGNVTRLPRPAAVCDVAVDYRAQRRPQPPLARCATLPSLAWGMRGGLKVNATLNPPQVRSVAKRGAFFAADRSCSLQCPQFTRPGADASGAR